MYDDSVNRVSISVDIYNLLVLLSTALMALGIIIYWLIWYGHRDSFERSSYLQALVDLISHIPTAASKPGLHIAAGMSFASGLSLLISTAIADILISHSSRTPDQLGGMVATIGGVLISIGFSGISLWTLWQTRRIEFQAGYKVHDFHDLISILDDELEKIITSYEGVYGRKAQPFHRVYLVTTHPFLGALTYPNSNKTTMFKNHLSTLTSCLNDDTDSKLIFRVLCGNHNAIQKFYSNYYASAGKENEKIIQKAKSVSSDIDEMNARVLRSGGQQPFILCEQIPPVQFMIVGNTLFEFTLESGHSQSEVFNTQVVHDSRYCGAYIKNFEIYQSVYSGGKNGYEH